MAKNLDNIVETIRSNHSKRIGIDIDNTLIHIPVIEYVNKKYGTNYTYADYKDWSLANFPTEIANDIRYQFTNPGFMCRATGYLWSYPAVRDWVAAGHKLYAITRRASHLIRDTKIQIEREFHGIFEDVFFVSQNDSKARILKKVNADIHIDDWDVNDSVRSGIKTWLITNEYTHYNHHMRNDHRLNQALALRYVKLDEKKWKQS